MSPTAIALILTAALAHASWNLFSKQAAAAGGAVFAWLLAAVATICYAPVIAVTMLVTRPHLALLNWVFLAGTGILQAGYFLFLQRGYRLGDLSVVYPIGRGAGALLAAIAGIALLGERPGAASLIGIGCIIIGIVVIGLPARADRPDGSDRPGRPDPPQRAPRAAPAVAFALATGGFIAAYTLWDKYAVSTLRTPPVLQGYAAFPVMVLLLGPFALASRPDAAVVWRQYRRQVVAAGLLAPLAYALVLVALSFTAVSVVAPAREVSVLFGVLLGRRMLGEPDLPRKLAAAALIVAGIITVAIG